MRASSRVYLPAPTLIVMGIAFLGVGLSEYFERRNLGVLAEPLQRTALLLPLLPVLAFWLRPPGRRTPPARTDSRRPP